MSRCKHEGGRCCIHGDPIWSAQTTLDYLLNRPLRRVWCTTCWKSLREPLPEPCTVTGQPHMGAVL